MKVTKTDVAIVGAGFGVQALTARRAGTNFHLRARPPFRRPRTVSRI